MPTMADIIFDLAPTAPHRLTDPETTFAPAADAFADYMHSLGPELNEKLPLLIELAGLVKPSGQSATSLTLSEGVKTNIAAGSGKTIVVGAPIRFASAADPAVDYMDGFVTAYNFVTGNMNVLIDNLGPSAAGTHTDWFWTVTGPRGSGGDTFPSLLSNAGKVATVNPGETAVQWVGRDWEQIATVSPSGAASAIISSIPQTYAEILCEASFTHPGTVSLGVQVSPDGSSYSSSLSLVDTTAGSYKGVFWFPRYTRDWGICIAHEWMGSSPSIGSGNMGNVHRWDAAGGLQALKWLFSSGNITGTFTLFGKK
jgi:hypothetical protein